MYELHERLQEQVGLLFMRFIFISKMIITCYINIKSIFISVKIQKRI